MPPASLSVAIFGFALISSNRAPWLDFYGGRQTVSKIVYVDNNERKVAQVVH